MFYNSISLRDLHEAYLEKKKITIHVLKIYIKCQGLHIYNCRLYMFSLMMCSLKEERREEKERGEDSQVAYFPLLISTAQF